MTTGLQVRMLLCGTFVLGSLSGCDVLIPDFGGTPHRTSQQRSSNLESAEWYSNRANERIQAKRYQEALDDCNIALAKGLDTDLLHRRRGFILQELDRHQETLEAFERALALNPGEFWNWNNRASGRYMMGDYSGAVIDAQKALTMRRDIHNPYVALGLAYSKLGKMDLSREAYREAKRLNPDFVIPEDARELPPVPQGTQLGIVSLRTAPATVALGQKMEWLVVYQGASKDQKIEEHWMLLLNGQEMMSRTKSVSRTLAAGENSFRRSFVMPQGASPGRYQLRLRVPLGDRVIEQTVEFSVR